MKRAFDKVVLVVQATLIVVSLVADAMRKG